MIVLREFIVYINIIIIFIKILLESTVMMHKQIDAVFDISD